LGSKVERRMREPSRGTEGAKEGEVWERGPPKKIFLDVKIKMAYFRGLCTKFRFFYHHNSIEVQSNTKTAMEIDLHAIKALFKGVYFSKYLEQSPQTQGKAPQASTGGKFYALKAKGLQVLLQATALLARIRFTSYHRPIVRRLMMMRLI